MIRGLIVLMAAVSFQASAAPNRPCEAIKTDCSKAGFVVGEAKEGKGMWWDCLCPLLDPGFQRPKNAALPTPSDPSAVQQCTSSNPGKQIIAKCNEMAAKKNAKSK